MTILQQISKELRTIADRIDSGASNMDQTEQLQLVAMLKQYTDKDTKMSKYQACQYLNMSRATFDNLVREGKLPKGKKEAGFKELFWTKYELDACI